MTKLTKGAVDLQGRFVPEKYLAGLPESLRKARIAELSAARSGLRGYEPLPTDIAARRLGLVRKSSYTSEAERRGIEHQGDFEDTAARAFRYYRIPASRRDVQTVARELEKVFKKGLAAWQTGGHRPGASQHSWAYARVASVLVGGKAAYTADKKNVAQFPVALQRAIDVQRMWFAAAQKNPSSPAAEVQRLLDTAPSGWRIAFSSHGLPAHPTVEQVVETMLEKTAGGNDAGPRGRATVKVPPEVAKDALRGLRLSHKADYAGWDGIGLARAVQLATQPTIWPRSVDRMRNFFSRNRRYEKMSGFGDDRQLTSSWLAWLNWGGPAADRWLHGAKANPKKPRGARSTRVHGYFLPWKVIREGSTITGRIVQLETSYRGVTYLMTVRAHTISVYADSRRVASTNAFESEWDSITDPIAWAEEQILTPLEMLSLTRARNNPAEVLLPWTLKQVLQGAAPIRVYYVQRSGRRYTVVIGANNPATVQLVGPDIFRIDELEELVGLPTEVADKIALAWAESELLTDLEVLALWRG